MVAGLTYGFEYGFIPWLGAWVPAVFGSSDWTSDIAEFLTPYRLVLLNLPLIGVYLLVLAEGIGRLAAPPRPPRAAALRSSVGRDLVGRPNHSHIARVPPSESTYWLPPCAALIHDYRRAADRPISH